MADPIRSLKVSRYFPEILPFSEFRTLAAASEAAPYPMLIHRVGQEVGLNKWLRIRDLRSQITAGVEVSVRSDSDAYSPSALAMPPIALGAFPTEIDLLCREFAALTVRNLTGAPIVAYPFAWNVAVWKASITERIHQALASNAPLESVLSADELRIMKKRGLLASVQKGTLPTSLDHRLQRYYNIVKTEPYAKTTAAVAANTRVALHRIFPKQGEFLVLRSISASPGALSTDNVRLYISRDDDTDYLEVFTWPLSTAMKLDCWVPATREIRIEVEAAAPLIGFLSRFTVSRVLFTDYLRMQFGLMSREENEDLYEVCAGGIA